MVSVEDGETARNSLQGKQGWGFARFRYKFGATFNYSRVNFAGKDEACKPHAPRGWESVLGRGGREKGNSENQPQSQEILPSSPAATGAELARV